MGMYLVFLYHTAHVNEGMFAGFKLSGIVKITFPVELALFIHLPKSTPVNFLCIFLN